MKSVRWIFAFIVPIWILRPALADEAPTIIEHLESLTRQEAVHLALAYHPQIVRAQARVRQAQARLEDARRWFSPKVSIYAGERFDEDSHRIGIQVSHDLEFLWNRARSREADTELAVAEQDLTLTRQSIVAEASAAYDDWIQARVNRRRTEERLIKARAALQKARLQYEEGLISSGRIAEMEKSLDEAERAAVEAVGVLTQKALRLRQAAGELGAP